MRTRLVVAWKPEVFSHEREAKILVKRRNAREPLGAHVRSFERANPIRSRHWGFCFRFWHGNLTNGFWLDRHVQKDLTCAPRGSLAFRLFASRSFLSEKTPLGPLGRLVGHSSTKHSAVTLTAILLGYSVLCICPIYSYSGEENFFSKSPCVVLINKKYLHTELGTSVGAYDSLSISRDRFFGPRWFVGN